MRRLTKCLILALAVLAALVAVGIWAGWNMWSAILTYWCALTVKNTIDYIAEARRK